MPKAIKRILFFLLIIFLIGAFFIFGYFAIQDIQATKAKEYLIQNYDLNSYDIFIYKTTEYVYDAYSACDASWFKVCTTDPSLYKDIIFIVDGEEYRICEYKDNTFDTTYWG